MNLDHVPATVRHYDVPDRVMHETWELLREGGREGVEAVVLWLGRVPDATRAIVLAAFAPPQIAYRSADGLAVEVPQDALTQLIGTLPPGVHVLVRVHSHAGSAYHSALDDTNMLIAHEGAVSVVVPNFAAGDPDLARCSVNVLRRDGRWRELTGHEVAERFSVT